MRKKYIFGKKLYISILTTIVVLLTTVATTFAWVGVFANSTFDTFNFGIKGSTFNEYSIEISLDGVEFHDSLSFEDIKEQLMLNMGYTQSQLDSPHFDIDSEFSKIRLDQCTTLPIIEDGSIKSLGVFTTLDGEITNKLYKFDLYISARKNYDSDISTDDYKLDVFLQDGLLESSARRKNLINPFTFPDDFVNPYDQMISNNLFELPNGVETIQANKTISSAKVKSASAGRVAFEKYKVVQKGHPEQYTLHDTPNSALIYHDGYDYPVYDTINDIYDFGAILQNQYNLSIGYYNSTEWQYADWHYWSVSLPNEMWIARGVESNTKDIRLTSKTNHLVDSSKLNEQIGVNTMMKVSCYFWFEGWDADCFNPLNLSPVSINIGFSMTNEDEF